MTSNAPMMSAAIAAVLTSVTMLTSTAPGLMPNEWNTTSTTSSPIPIGEAALGDSPASRTTYCPHATATAAVAPDWMISNIAQP